MSTFLLFLFSSYSSNGQYLLAGSDNGSVEIHKLTDPYSLSGLKEEAHGLWSLGTHDNHYGQVSCMSLTYDDQYLLTGGGDGNVFVYKTNFSTSRPSTSHTAKVYIHVHVHVHTCILIP